jgi:hypothetical protein
MQSVNRYGDIAIAVSVKEEYREALWFHGIFLRGKDFPVL